MSPEILSDWWVLRLRPKWKTESRIRIFYCPLWFLSVNTWKIVEPAIPSIPIVNSSTEKIIHGCMKYSISIGLCSPSFDFCIINWANVHRIPLVVLAIITNMKPNILNCVALYVNIHRPDDINTTINIKNQLCEFREETNKKSKIR